MSTTTGISNAYSAVAPAGWLGNGISTGVLAFSAGLAVGIIAGGILGLWLFFRFYVLDGTRAIETYAGREWGEE